MDGKDRSAVLVAVSNGPLLGIKVFLSYLRLKRAANRARGQFYQELLSSGVPGAEARWLADEYASAVSVRRMMGAAQCLAPEGRSEEKDI
mgnify:CR=1 FL=1